jgi:hypothetical protein
LLYLGLPVFLFAVHWLNLGAALFFSGILLLGLWQAWNIHARPNSLSLSQLLSEFAEKHAIVFTVFLLWMTLSGVGGIGHQNTDYAASNALLKDLIDNPWPLHLRDRVPLVYYVCYYLPAALIGKWLGWNAAWLFIFVWTYIGLILFWSVLSIALGLDNLSRWRQLCAALVFVFVGGWDVLGALLNYPSEVLSPGTHIEWWAKVAQFSSHTTLLFWVPQHVLAPWLATAFLLLAVLRNLGSESIFLIAAFAFLWSPIASLGLLPFLGAMLVLQFMGNRGEGFINSTNVFVAPALALLGLFYYASNAFNFPNAWQWGEQDFARNYGLLIGLEVLPLALPFLLQHMKQKVFLNEISLPQPLQLNASEKAFGWAAIALLLVLPLYRIGIMNDLCMRASVPAILVLASFFLRVLRQEFTFQTLQRAAVAACLLLGAGSAASEIYRSLNHYSMRIPPREAVSSLLNSSENSVVEQRAGDPEAFFWHWLGPIRNGESRNPVQKSN